MSIDTEEIRQELAKQGKIALVWSIEDVKSLRVVSDDEAFEVLLSVEHNHDAGIGVNWDVIAATADSMFPGRAAPEDEEDEN